MTVRFRDEALQDLEEIAGYIARPPCRGRRGGRIYDTLDLVPRNGHTDYGAHEIRRPPSSLRHRLQTDAR